MKKIFFSFLIVILLIGMSGCTKAGTDNSGYQIYYTNLERTELSSESYHPQAEDTDCLLYTSDAADEL